MPPLRRIVPIIFGLVFFLLISLPVASTAQDDADFSRRLQELESKVDHLERKVADVEEAAGIGAFVLFLFANAL